MTTRKQQNSIKEAQLVGQLIGGFAATNPQAYKMVCEYSGEEFLGGHVVDASDFYFYVMTNISNLPKAKISRVYRQACQDFHKVTGYGLVNSDLSTGRYAQYDVTPVDFIFTLKTNEEMAAAIEDSLGFIIGGSSSQRNYDAYEGSYF